MGNIKTVLVANRGEIALRVMRTCRELGLSTVAVYSEADRTAPHVRYADKAVLIGPPPSKESYLVGEKILAAARATGADAIHPGYGFLSENPTFARACDAAGITFIGPPATAMEAMGEKTTARSNMMRAGVPVVPGAVDPLKSFEEARKVAEEVGFPIMLKAAGGGGGKGMRRVERMEDLESAWRSARSESANAFGNDAVYIEKFLDEPHHVEIQVFADNHGNCIHLSERECSVQRRNQKVIEETPSPILTPQLRASMGEIAVKAAKAVNYRGAGTIEFLVDAKRNFYFLEMNTRLQVEHPVTEWVTGVDLVAWQIHVANGGVLPQKEPIHPRGHAIEVRVYAEDPKANFMPSPGRIERVRAPSGPFVRDDSGVYSGYTVPNIYDPMISKLSVWGATRQDALARMRRALDEYALEGMVTNIPYLRAILRHKTFIEGNYDTGFLGRAHKELLAAEDASLSTPALIAAALRAHKRAQRPTTKQQKTATASRWRTARSRWGGR